MVASSTFLDRLLISSVARTTISVRLQNWYGRKIISEQGLQANSQSASRLPFLAACFCAACLLKIPRSPDLDSTSAVHSRKNVSMSGFSV